MAQPAQDPEAGHDRPSNEQKKKAALRAQAHETLKKNDSEKGLEQAFFKDSDLLSRINEDARKVGHSAWSMPGAETRSLVH